MEKKDHVLLGAALTVGAVEDWLGEHVDPETGYVVDDTLAIEGAAADSKATGEAIAAVEAKIPAVDNTLSTAGAAAEAKKTGQDIANLASAVNAIGYTESAIDISSYDTVYGMIAYGNYWAISSTSNESALITDIPARISVTASSGSNTYVSFFKQVPTQPESAYDQVFFCDGETGRHLVSRGTTEKLDVPFDCVCVVITIKINGNTSTPTAVSGEFLSEFLEEIPQLRNDVNGLETDVTATQTDIDNLEATSYTTKNFPQSAYGQFTRSVSDGRNMGEYANRVATVSYLPLHFKSISAQSGYQICLMAYNSPELSTATYVGSWNGTTLSKPNSPYWVSSVQNPNDNYYYCVSIRKSDNSNITPAAVYDKVSYNYNSIDLVYDWMGHEEKKYPPIGLHVYPESEGVVNAIKRARQLSDMKWTPLADLPRSQMVTNTVRMANRQTFEDEFSQGVEYSGIPYGDTENVKQMLAVARPLDVFATSLCNTNSALYVESTYHDLYSTYYYNACTGLVAYALGFPVTYSMYYSRIEGMSLAFALMSGSARHALEDLKLCDVLQISGHCALVTDIIYDDDGKVAFVEVTEQTLTGNSNNGVTGTQYGGKARRKTWTVDEFFDWFGSFSVYRYAYLSSVKYTQNPYAPVGNEGDRICEPYFPIMPYHGNRCLEQSSTTVKLLISGTGYTHVVVMKNGVAWNEDGTTDPYTVSGTELTIHCSNENAEYSAYLATYENNAVKYYTKACEWYVYVGATATAAVSGSNVNFSVTMNTAEFKPWFTNIQSQSSTDGYNHIVSDDYTDTAVGENHTFTYSEAFTGDTPEKFLTGLWSDKYGLIEIIGNIT